MNTLNCITGAALLLFFLFKYYNLKREVRYLQINNTWLNGAYGMVNRRCAHQKKRLDILLGMTPEEIKGGKDRQRERRNAEAAAIFNDGYEHRPTLK